MLTIDQFEAWCRKLHISVETSERILRIRTTEPSRKVKSSAANVSGSYCSRKMGLTMQFESHKVELPLIVTYMEWDSDVLEYYDQPETIKLNYKSQVGRNLGVIYTPDFFVIRSNSAGYEECKTESELEKLAQKNPGRYKKDENGVWHCPPGEEFAARFGLYFRVRSSSEINWTCYRNLEYLQDYFRSPYEVHPEIKNVLYALVHAQEGITFQELLDLRKDDFTTDDINAMLTNRELYFNTYKACFDDLQSVAIYTSQQEAIMRDGADMENQLRLSPTIDVVAGKILDWDGAVYQIINVGEHTVSLQSAQNEILTLDVNQIQHLVSTNQVKINSASADSISSSVQRIIKSASPKELEIANQRAETVKQYLNGEKDKIKKPLRTVRDWVKAYKEAQEVWGEGYLGLIPKISKRGNRTPRLCEEVLTKIKEVISLNYEGGIQTAISYAYGFLKNECEGNGYIAPSYPTVWHYTQIVSSRYDQTLKRQGSRAAYQHQPFYWELERTTPRHGARPFEVAHIDHTEFDIELKEPEGRPWGTIMIDAYSRRLLAVYITMDPPSYRSNMMVIRECVKRFNRLPQNIIVDGGKDFSSVYFEQLLARYEVTKKVRPRAKSHFGSICERMFGTSDTELIHNLVGNTQLTKEVRKLTKKFNPKNLAVWDLESFTELVKTWGYNYYDMDDHPALGESPRSAFQKGLDFTGQRKNRYILYDCNFEFATLPTSRKGTAKIFPGRGFKLNYLYYWSDEFRIPELEGKSVSVRYDPWNMGIAYAFIQGEWVECISEYFSIFNGRTEREIMLASEELRKKNSNSNKKYTVSAAQLAEFFKKTVHPKEKELAKKQETMPNTLLLQVVKESSKNEDQRLQAPSGEKIKCLPLAEKRTVPRQIYEEF